MPTEQEEEKEEEQEQEEEEEDTYIHTAPPSRSSLILPIYTVGDPIQDTPLRYEPPWIPKTLGNLVRTP